jgi:uncharacterized protein involved in outer membrane biogenesis
VRTGKVIAVGITVITIAVTGAGIALSRVDPAVYKDFLAQTVREATGREVLVRGKTELRLLPAPTLVAENVLFSNASWSVSPDMVRVKRLEAQVALAPLLVGQLRVTRFTLHEPNVLLERDAKGRPNWRIRGAASDNDGDSTPATLPRGLRLVVSRIRIIDGHLTYRDRRHKGTRRLHFPELSARGDLASGALTVEGLVKHRKRSWGFTGKVGELSALLRNEPYDIALTLLTSGLMVSTEGVIERPLEGEGLWMDVRLRADSLRKLAAVVGAKVPVDGAVQGSAKLTDVAQGYRLEKIDAKVNLQGGKATVTGSIDNLVRMRGLHLNLDLGAKTLVGLASFGLGSGKLAKMGPIKASATLTNPKGRHRLDDIKGRVHMGGAVLRFDGTITKLGRMRGLDLGVTLKAKSLAKLSRLAGVDLPPVGPLEASARVSRSKYGLKLAKIDATVGRTDLQGQLFVYPWRKRPRVAGKLVAGTLDLDQLLPGTRAPKSGRVFSSKPLPIQGLHRFDSDIDIKARNVRLRRLRLQKVLATLSVKEGRMKLEPKGQIAGGTFRGELSVDASGKRPRVATRFRGLRIKLGPITEQLYDAKLIDGGRIDINIDLKGRGSTMSELAAGLWGGVHLESGKATINNKLVDKTGGDVATSMLRSVTMQNSEETVTHMKCGVVRMVVKDGKVNADRSIAMETDRLLMSASGTIDLRDERIDFGVNTRARYGFQTGAGSLSGLVRIRGTIGEPDVGADAMGVAGVAVSVAGAVVTAGISLLAQGILSQVIADREPCKTAVETMWESGSPELDLNDGSRRDAVEVSLGTGRSERRSRNGDDANGKPGALYKPSDEGK